MTSLKSETIPFSQNSLDTISNALEEAFQNKSKEVDKDYWEAIINAAIDGRVGSLFDLNSELLIAHKNKKNDASQFQSEVNATKYSLRRFSAPWTIEFTPSFSKSLKYVDTKNKGRILTAVSELSYHAATAKGDTIKPLSGDKEGMWRYRIGDYRLVYLPQDPPKCVKLLDFSSRGSVY